MRGYEGEESKVDERILDERKGTSYKKEDRKEKISNNTGDVRRKEIRDEDKEENRRGNGMGHKENM